MLVLVLPRVSSRVSGVLVASPCQGGSCKTCPFGMFQTVKIGGSLARNAGFDVPTCLVSSLWFSCGFACLWGKLQNLSFSNVSKQVVMLFCVADVALSDIPTCLITCRKCQTWRKSRTKCSFFCTYVSRLESLVFLWRRRVYMGEAAKYVLFEGFQAGCHVVLRGRGGTL